MQRGFVGGMAAGGGGAPGHRTPPPASYDGKIAGLYDLEETLGAGHFAVVKLARHVFTGEKVAVKVIDKSKLDEVSRAHLFQEVRCMKLVQHPNVVRLYEVIDTQTKLYLILELGDGGDLYDYIMKHESGLSESLAKDYFRQIVRAISYCHRLHVVHRDLKPENVVFFERLGVVKLTDFGFSNKFCPGQKLETSCGSLAYSAPEILLGDSYDAPAVDVWSLGVILFMLVCGQAPFQEANDSETLIMIMDCKYTIPSYVSAGCKRLISRMLVREPERRATLNEIATDSWLSDGCPDGSDLADLDAPLVSRQQLTGDDHAIIIQKMVNGKIAAKDQILDALEKNAYNHITATYYLLAERKLRSQRGDQQTSTTRCTDTCPSSRIAGAVSSLLRPPTAVGPVSTCGRGAPGDGTRARKCSIVREDEEGDEEDEEEESSRGGPCGEGRPTERRPSRSEGRLDLALQARLARAPPPPPPQMMQKVNLDDENTRARLGEIGIGHVASWMPFKKVMRPVTAIPTKALPSYPTISVTDADGKPGKLPLLAEDGGANRRVSRSSSEASEDESEGRKKRPAPPAARARELPRPRRDSHDDSSGDSCGTAGGGGTTAAGGNSTATRSASSARAAAPPRRRRRTPRKETRLRESRSLNRISETSEAQNISNTVSVERPEDGRRRWLAALMGRARSLGPGAGGGALLRLVAGRGSPLAPLAPLAVCRLHVGDASKCCGLC